MPPPSGHGSQISVKGFFGSLFDYSFSHSVTSHVVKWVYVLITVLTALWYISTTITIFAAGGDEGTALGVLFLLVIGPILSILNLVIWRIMLEFFRAVVSMAEDIRQMKNARMGL